MFDTIMIYKYFVETENRFAILSNVNKENKNKLIKQSETDAQERRKEYKNKGE